MLVTPVTPAAVAALLNCRVCLSKLESTLGRMPERVARVWELSELRELLCTPCSSESRPLRRAISVSLSASRVACSASSAEWPGPALPAKPA